MGRWNAISDADYAAECGNPGLGNVIQREMKKIVCNACGQDSHVPHGWKGLNLCGLCSDRLADDERGPRKLTRQERQEGLADRGVDTWEEAKCER